MSLACHPARLAPVLLALALFITACSSGSSTATPHPDSSITDAAHSGHDATAPADAHTHHDAHPHPRDASADAPSDATLDATPDSPTNLIPPDASDATFDSPVDAPPPTLCPGGRNVFTLAQSQPGGPLGNTTTTTLTNLDSLWSLGTSPFDITATPGSGAAASLEVTLPFGATLAPGTYPQGHAAPDGGPVVDLSFAGNECQQTSGTFTLASLTGADAGVTSMLATFSLACAVGPGQTDEVNGCVRYQAQPGPIDAGISPPEPGYDAGLASAGDAGALAPCLGDPQAFYVTGSPLTAIPEMLTGAEGDWSAGQNGNVTLTVDSTNRWILALGAMEGESLTVGTTYTGAGNLPGAPAYFSLLANGVDCGSPTASFTVYDYADTGGDEATVTRLAATFTVTCSGSSGTGVVSGCVHYIE